MERQDNIVAREINDDLFLGLRASREAPPPDKLPEPGANGPEEESSWLDLISRHKVVTATIGGAACTALGFATGGVFFSHRRHHLRTA